MAAPTQLDMITSLEDARFFHEILNTIIRGPEQGHDLVLIRRYFRAYLHCWKTVLHLVREAKGLGKRRKDDEWKVWIEKWSNELIPSDFEIFECLRRTRDHDTHSGMIEVTGEVAAGLYPIVMFNPGKTVGLRRELISCCDRGLFIVDDMIQRYSNID